MANESRELTDEQLQAAGTMFSALADPARLRLIVELARGEATVSDLAAATREKLTTVSARLGLLWSARLVARRRDGKSMLYRLHDAHVLTLVSNALDHACEDHHS